MDLGKRAAVAKILQAPRNEAIAGQVGRGVAPGARGAAQCEPRPLKPAARGGSAPLRGLAHGPGPCAADTVRMDLIVVLRLRQEAGEGRDG